MRTKNQEPRTENHWRAIIHRPSFIVHRLIAAALFLAFLVLYVRTAAPSVLSGDSAEFQMAAVLLGVPHPTTYPLYIMLGKLATLVIPFYDLARRVTLVSSVAATLAVALLFLLARRVTSSTLAALVAALALGLSPGLWNAATMAEVYALLALLLVALGYALLTTNDGGRTTDVTRSPAHPLTLAAFIAGLGFSHHGLFAFTGMPLFAGYVLWWMLGRRRAGGGGRRTNDEGRTHGSPLHTRSFAHLLTVAVGFALGLTPWLYPLVQYARFGPFNGQDYGLPRHYFWGAAASWPEAADVLLGGAMRSGVFRVPSVQHIGAMLALVSERLPFEFGPLGVALGVLGCGMLLWRQRGVWLGTAALFGGTLLYLLLLGPAVQDAPVFTLPLLLPWALWVGVGAAALARTIDGRRWTMATSNVNDYLFPHKWESIVYRPSSIVVLLLIAATLAWGSTRAPYANKRHLWLFREWGQATLQQLPPRAAVLAHWEQGMTLQYLVLAEQQRPDVWIDVVEPGDVPWGTRAARYPDRPVFFVGAAADVAGLPVEQISANDYAALFRLRR